MRSPGPIALRAQVKRALEEHQANRERAWSIQGRVTESALELARREFPKRKIDDLNKAITLIGGTPEWAERCSRFVEERRTLEAERDVLKKRIDELALTAAVLSRTGRWLPLTETSSYNYSTQGYGAHGYAQREAEMLRDETRALGVNAELWERRDRINYGGTPFCFQGDSHSLSIVVCVQVDEPVDVEILKRRPSRPMHERVRDMWRRGSNPRVVYPFLPHDYEKLHGFDCMGRDLTR